MDEPGLPLEQFIQALTSQLDRAQETMALKARAGLPLTFAVKDLTIDLRTHVGMSGSVVHIRPAGPGDAEASVIHLSLTTITRPMIEENTQSLESEKGPSVQEAFGDKLGADELRRLEWAGIRSVSQLRELQKDTGAEVIGRVSQLPIDRLRAALAAAAAPHVSHVVAAPDDGAVPAAPGAPPPLRIRGWNLRDGGEPQVSIAGRPAAVLQASDTELLVQPDEHVAAGTLEVRTTPDLSVAASFDLTEEPT
jgi:hypothetical protein